MGNSCACLFNNNENQKGKAGKKNKSHKDELLVYKKTPKESKSFKINNIVQGEMGMFQENLMSNGGESETQQQSPMNDNTKNTAIQNISHQQSQIHYP